MTGVLAETQASDSLRRMTENPKIQERLPGYTTSMGYGLHVGWAIEGAIGSMLKIDASYLSPNVNLAARLETGTNQFGVDILISEQVFSMIRPDLQRLLRKIDCVTMKGSTQPIALYTYDVPRVTANTIEELYKEAEEEEEEFDFWDYFRPLTSTTYRKRHADAVQLYLEGNWLEAKKSFELCLLEWADDGPSKVSGAAAAAAAAAACACASAAAAGAASSSWSSLLALSASSACFVV